MKYLIYKYSNSNVIKIIKDIKLFKGIYCNNEDDNIIPKFKY